MTADTETLERALLDDLQHVRERFADEEFSHKAYRTLTRDKLSKRDVATGHVTLSFKQAEELINDFRRGLDRPELTLAQTGGEGEVDPDVRAALEQRGWHIAPARTGGNDPQHDHADASPPPQAAEEPEWKRRGDAEADAELRRRRAP
jgi:hypothetical protein